jgi:hypothetical protein
MRDDRPPGDPSNNPKDRKAWEQQGWVIERETGFNKTPENGWIDLTQPLSDDPPPLSEEHRRHQERFEERQRTAGFCRWMALRYKGRLPTIAGKLHKLPGS